MTNWTDLSTDILGLIAQRLTSIEDFASFSAASKECQLVAAMLKKKASLPPRHPRLVLAENENEPSRGFLNLLTSTTIGVEMPEARGTNCFGAHYGWLFTLGSDLQINLLHPFSKQQIYLPPMLTFPDQYNYDEEFSPQNFFDVFVSKIAISASPLKGRNLNDECHIVALYGQLSILAIARLGDTVWTNIRLPDISPKCYTDAVYYEGKFYATNTRGLVVVCDIHDNNGPKATVVADALGLCPNYDQCNIYLVESAGDLLLVTRERRGSFFTDNDDDKEEHRYYTVGFSVLRLDESRDASNNCTYNRTKVTTLGDRALFLGRNVSTSKASSEYIKPNCIYFTDDHDELYGTEPGGGGGHDTGIFYMENGNVEFDYARGSRSLISPPFWYI